MKQRNTLLTRLSALLAVLALCSAAGVASANCVEPSFDVNLPDGKSANADAMKAAQEAVQALVERGEAYVECVNANEAPARRDRMVNSALDKMQKVAADFNRELRYFRRAN